MAQKPKLGWTQIREWLHDWPPESMLNLVKDLYQASKANRDFLHARFLAEEGGESSIEPYRKTVVDQFYPKRGFGRLKLGKARQAIRAYTKATGDLVGTADLLLTYIENGAAFTAESGDMEDPFYNSMASAIDELTELLLKDGGPLYATFRERIQRLPKMANEIEPGCGDDLYDLAETLESELGGNT